MPRLTALSRKIWNPGTYTSSDIPIPLGLTRVTVMMERNSWPVRPGSPPESEVVRWKLWLSYDGGQTWEESWGAGCEGGDSFNFRTGVLQTHSTLTFDLPQPDNSQRMGRVSMEVVERLRTQIDFDIV